MGASLGVLSCRQRTAASGFSDASRGGRAPVPSRAAEMICLAEFVEILHGLVGVLLGLLEDVAGLLVGLPQDAVSLGVQLLLLCGVSCLQGTPAPACRLRSPPAPVRWCGGCSPDPSAGPQRIRSCSLKCFLASSMSSPGRPSFAGDGKGVALAGDADEQPVGGAQGLHVEFAAGIFHPGCGQGEDLQLAVVGGGHGADALPVEMLQDGDGQRRALRGIGARAQLVEEHQAVR